LLQDTIITAFAELVEFRDVATSGHIFRIQLLFRSLIEKMFQKNIYPGAILPEDIDMLIEATKLHDVGKIYIPEAILNKAGQLDYQEYEIKKTHTTLGRDAIIRIMSKVDEGGFLEHASIMAYSHHERWDGTGYPLGLSGEAIPIQGRIMAIADVYDALITERPYKSAFSHKEAVEIIRFGKGSQFDPFLVEVFEDIQAEFENIIQKNQAN
jgi:putative two-component system response regulator